MTRILLAAAALIVLVPMLHAAAEGKVVAKDLPQPFSQILALDQSKDPSLALALSGDPAGELNKSYASIKKSDDVKVDDKTFTALKLSTDAKAASPSTTLLIDPATHLLRRAVIDLAPDLLAKGASDVKKALLTIDYVTVKADGPGR